jgi:PAS domain S-box-containing protein
MLCILIVEDSPDDALLVERHLVRAGYKVCAERVESAAAMQEALSRREWDAIVSDYTIPGFGALPALHLLKQSRFDIPFIVLSGTIDEETAVSVMRAGAHDYILKDNLTRLVPAIEREIQEATERRRRRQTDAALRDMQERFRATFNQAAVGMTHSDLEGVWLMVNQRFCDLLGYCRDELSGRKFQEFTHPEDLPLDLENIRRLLRGECESYTIEKRYFRRNGTTVPVNLTRSLVRDGSGQPKYFIGVVEDITRRRTAEAERSRLLQMLIANEKLAAAGRMAGMLAHEINNPLAAVTNVMWLLQARTDLPPDVRSMIELAATELNRVTHITKSTLSFYRESPAPVSVNLPELLGEVLRLYARQAQDQRVVVQTRFHGRGMVLGQPGALRQVFSNLISNALEAMPDGGRLFVRCACGSDGADGVSVVVADTGSGISPSDRASIFQPFFTTKGERGTGLGLWVSLGIVQKHQGNIKLRSSTAANHHGTVFRVSLRSGLPSSQGHQAA